MKIPHLQSMLAQRIGEVHVLFKKALAKFQMALLEKKIIFMST